jgi:hypothetical protein
MEFYWIPWVFFWTTWVLAWFPPHADRIAHLNDLIERVKKIPGVREASVEGTTYLVKVEPKYNLRN